MPANPTPSAGERPRARHLLRLRLRGPRVLRPGHRRRPALRARPHPRGPAADRQREPLLAEGAHRPRLDAVQQVRRGLRAGATTAAAPRSTRPSRSRSTGARRSSTPTTPTSRRTRAPAPTRRSTARSCSRATRSSPCLPHGGHLTHGTKVSFSGKWFNAVHYGVDKNTEDIDYDQVASLAREHRPKVILAGGSAIPRLIDFEFFRNLADEVGAIFWVDAAHFIGLVAGKAIPSRCPTPTS